jgi:hypothetical protein
VLELVRGHWRGWRRVDHDCGEGLAEMPGMTGLSRVVRLVRRRRLILVVICRLVWLWARSRDV